MLLRASAWRVYLRVVSTAQQLLCEVLHVVSCVTMYLCVCMYVHVHIFILANSSAYLVWLSTGFSLRGVCFPSIKAVLDSLMEGGVISRTVSILLNLLFSPFLLTICVVFT